jgi:hypothetical protein
MLPMGIASGRLLIFRVHLFAELSSVSGAVFVCFYAWTDGTDIGMGIWVNLDASVIVGAAQGR